MRKPISPCKDCTPETGRTVQPNCHEKCEKYLRYKSDVEEWKSLVNKNRKPDKAVESFFAERTFRKKK